MKRVMLLAAAVAWCLGANTSRAETPPMFNWTGFYFGVNGGGINYGTDGRQLNGNGWRTDDIDVGLGGVHAGYQIQTGNFVWGLEVAWDGLLSDKLSSRFGPSVASQCGLPGAYCQAQIKDIFQVGPRVGFASGQWMLYATGGYARAEIDSSLRIPGAAAVDHSDAHHDGWYVGGGLDFFALRNLVLGVEYKHFDFSSERHDSAVLGTVRNFDAKADAVFLRLTIKQ